MPQAIAPTRDALRTRIEKYRGRKILPRPLHNQHGFVVLVPPENQAVGNTGVVAFAEGLDIILGIVLGVKRRTNTGNHQEKKKRQAAGRCRRAGKLEQ